MTRAERLLALLELLQSREEVRASELAEALGTSLRSVRRDLATLRARGTVIESATGPGGGVRLARERGVTAVHVTADEVVALWLTVHLMKVATALPWSRAARSGLDKLFASVSRERARALRLLCRRIVVGEPANDVVWSTAKAPPKELLGLFEQAFTRGIGLGFDYSDRLGVASVRRIEPHGLLVKAPVWYVLARDCDKLAPRSFRMDRIASPRLLPAVTFRPDLEIVRELSARHNSYR